MPQVQVQDGCLEIDLSATCADLNLSFRSDTVSIRQELGPELTLSRAEITSIRIEPNNAETLIEVEDLGAASLPPIDVGYSEREVLVYGSTRTVLAEGSQFEKALVIEGSTPEELTQSEERVTEFNQRNRLGKNLFERASAAFLRLVGRDAKLGFDTWGDVMQLWDKMVDGHGLRRLYLEFLAKRNHADIKADTLKELKQVLQPGDVLLRFQRGFPLDPYFVGYWQHAGACIDGKANVVDALAEGVGKRPLEKFAHADGVVVLRPQFTGDQKREFLNYLRLQLGKAYNYWFSADANEHYCSGLVHHALAHSGLADPRMSTVRPDELLSLPKLSLVWTNRPDLVDAAMKEAARKTDCKAAA